MKVSDSTREQIREHKRKFPEDSSRSIARFYSIHHKTVNRILRESENKSNVKILFLDIETFPNIGFTWGKYQQDVIEFIEEGCIACFAAKWLGEETFAKALPDYKGYKPKSYDDFHLVEDLWKLLNEADVIVAHKGDSFDIKIIYARFLVHNMLPPAPFKTVDTLKAVKKVARFNSNRLNDLSRMFIDDQKISTSFGLWKGCINGDPESWSKMVEYNKKDVDILESVYLRLLPYISNHPNHGVFEDVPVCPKCGSSDLHSRGFARTATRIYQRYQCQNCGGWSRAIRSEKNQGPEFTNL